MTNNELDTQWLKDIRQSMDNYEEELPEDGWKAIMAETEAKACPQVSRRGIRHVSSSAVKWAAAAACVVGFSVWCDMPGAYEKLDMGGDVAEMTSDRKYEQAAEEMRQAMAEAMGIGGERDGKETAERVEPMRIAKVEKIKMTEKAGEVEERVVEKTDERFAEKSEERGDKVDESGREKEIVTESVVVVKNNGSITAAEKESREEKRQLRGTGTGDGWNLGLHVGGNGLAGSGTDGYPYGDMGPKHEIDGVESEEQDKVIGSDDHMSMSFGVGFGKQLTDRMSVVTGLVYTRLTSTVEMSLSGEQDQTLHYLGIPVGVRYNLLERSRWTVYGGGCVTMEKCVGARRGEEKIKVGGLQWSMSASAGCQYNLFGHLGLYVEPGVKWYVNDHADVPSIRTEHPCSFNMMMGIRLNY